MRISNDYSTNKSVFSSDQEKYNYFIHTWLMCCLPTWRPWIENSDHFSHVVSPFVWSCVQTAAMARRNKTVIDDHPRIIVPATLPEYDTEW